MRVLGLPTGAPGASPRVGANRRTFRSRAGFTLARGGRTHAWGIVGGPTFLPEPFALSTQWTGISLGSLAVALDRPPRLRPR